MKQKLSYEDSFSPSGVKSLVTTSIDVQVKLFWRIKAFIWRDIEHAINALKKLLEELTLTLELARVGEVDVTGGARNLDPGQEVA